MPGQVSRLAPAGVVVVLDNESRSANGFMKDAKKILVRHFGVNLVPRSYWNARYFGLRQLGEGLRREGVLVDVRTRANGPRRALVVRAVESPESRAFVP
jgi:hypothetical protein